MSAEEDPEKFADAELLKLPVMLAKEFSVKRAGPELTKSP